MLDRSLSTCSFNMKLYVYSWISWDGQRALFLVVQVIGGGSFGSVAAAASMLSPDDLRRGGSKRRKASMGSSAGNIPLTNRVRVYSRQNFWWFVPQKMCFRAEICAISGCLKTKPVIGLQLHVYMSHTSPHLVKPENNWCCGNNSKLKGNLRF